MRAVSSRGEGRRPTIQYFFCQINKLVKKRKAVTKSMTALRGSGDVVVFQPLRISPLVVFVVGKETA